MSDWDEYAPEREEEDFEDDLLLDSASLHSGGSSGCGGCLMPFLFAVALACLFVRFLS